MTKKWGIAIGIILLIIISGYLYLRYGFLHAKDFKPQVAKEKNAVDLRPSIIAKLQQLVKDGSNGLYVLSIDKIEPDILASKVDVINASIHIDTASMVRLNSLKLLPDDIFTFHFKSLHIDGIGIEDLLNKDRINVKNISVTDPVISIFHKPRAYNEAERERKDTLSLYQRLKGQMKEIAIGNIQINRGTLINHNSTKAQTTKFSNVSIRVNDLLIDSATEHDNSRFLFAKHINLNTKNYSIATPDSLYLFKVDDIAISGDKHNIVASNVELKPRYTRQQFEGKLQYRKEMYHMAIPKVSLYGVNWWAMINNEKFLSTEAVLSGGTFSIFLDRSKQSHPEIKVNNFPQQLLMNVPVPVSVTKLLIQHINLSYEEFSRESQQHGVAYFDNINAQANYISNIPAETKKHPTIYFSGSTMFMHHVPMTAKFTLDLKKYRTGEFTAEVHMNQFDSSTINSVAEPLGLFSVKRGVMQDAIAHVEGNNYNMKGNIAMKYTDLHITPLKRDKDEGRLKSKSFTSFFANKLLIKDKNPIGGELRQPEYSVERDHHPNFINSIWVTILTGILKTIGIPVKLVIK